MNSNKIYLFIGNFTSLYDWALYVVGYQKSVEYFVSQLPFNQEDTFTVLDAGCGTGLYTLAVLKRFRNATVTAFDFNDKLVDRLSKKAVQNNYGNRVSLFSGDIQGPLSQITGQKFDIIVTSGVLEYVPLESTIKSLSQFLKPKGYFFNSPVSETIWGRVVATIYGCKPYGEIKNTQAFKENNFALQKIIRLPWYKWVSYKEVNMFRSNI
jgi:2-polyprenyl-3-methyl-5-hydroxy-6-metoxy-1,4-benzoquinol methylase